MFPNLLAAWNVLLIVKFWFTDVLITKKLDYTASMESENVSQGYENDFDFEEVCLYINNEVCLYINNENRSPKLL